VSDDKDDMTSIVRAIAQARKKARIDREQRRNSEPAPRVIYLDPITRDNGSQWFRIEASGESNAMLATVFAEGLENESVCFVDHTRDLAVYTDKLSDDFIVESIHEIGKFILDKRISDLDGDLLIRHLNAELLKRLG
jgi:hypothetical protein